jgi:hypothetical protein
MSDPVRGADSPDRLGGWAFPEMGRACQVTIFLMALLDLQNEKWRFRRFLKNRFLNLMCGSAMEPSEFERGK